MDQSRAMNSSRNMGRSGEERLIFKREFDKKEAGNNVAGLAQDFLPWISAESSGVVGSYASSLEEALMPFPSRVSVMLLAESQLWISFAVLLFLLNECSGSPYVPSECMLQRT